MNIEELNFERNARKFSLFRLETFHQRYTPYRTLVPRPVSRDSWAMIFVLPADFTAGNCLGIRRQNLLAGKPS
jgi:hypothetical protein